MVDLVHLFSSWDKDDSLEVYNSYKSRSLGSRLGNIRQARGLTQAQLDERVGMKTDFTRKYEKGVRRPKDVSINRFAEILGVSPLAIVEPTITGSSLQSLYALFELERLFGISVKDQNGELSFDFSHCNCDDAEVAGLKKGLQDWAEMRTLIDQKIESASEEEAEIILLMYKEWLWNYPKFRSSDIVDEIDRRIEKTRINGKTGNVE